MKKKVTLYKVTANYTVTPEHVELYDRLGVKDRLIEKDDDSDQYSSIYNGCEVGANLLLALLPHVEVTSKRELVFDDSELEDVDA